MSNLNYLLSVVKEDIPLEILNEAFNANIPLDLVHMTSLDDKIMNMVLRKTVLRDLQMIGGVELMVPLNGLMPMVDQYYNAVYRIPFDRTNNRTINEVLGIASTILPGPGNFTGAAGNGFGGGMGGIRDRMGGPYDNVRAGGGCFTPNTLTDTASKVYNSHAPINSDFNAAVEIIGPNTILIYGLNYFSGMSLGLRCNVDYDPNFNDFQQRTLKFISEFAILAIKKFIYRTLIIRIDTGMLSGGQDFNRFSSIVESYEHAIEDYKIYLKEIMGGVTFLNSTQKKYRFLKALSSMNL